MPTPFSPSTLARLERRLARRRMASAQRAAALAADATYALDDHDVSDLLDSASPNGGSHAVDRGHALTLGELTARAAADIDAAYERLASGDYGFCQRCRARIPLARLLAVPETALCVACKVAEARLVGAGR